MRLGINAHSIPPAVPVWQTRRLTFLFKLSLHLAKCLFTQVEHWLNQLCEDLSDRICSDLDQNKRIAQTLTLHVSAYKVLFFSSLSEAFNWIFLSKQPFGIFFYTHIPIYICACLVSPKFSDFSTKVAVSYEYGPISIFTCYRSLLLVFLV